MLYKTRSRLFWWLRRVRPLWEYYNRRYTDFLLLSYPKCGRTWLRALIGHAIDGHFDIGASTKDIIRLTPLSHAGKEVPRIVVSHDDNPQWKKPENVESTKNQYTDDRVIFLVRDPRDVIVSHYYQAKKRRDKFEGPLSQYIREPIGGIKTLVEFYNVWYENRDIPEDFLLVRYEDLQEDDSEELSRVLDFLGIEDISKQCIREATDFAAFDNMRRLEKRGVSQELSPGDPEDKDSYKTRKGEVGGYREELDPKDVAFIEDAMTELTSWYGYEPNRKVRPDS